MVVAHNSLNFDDDTIYSSDRFNKFQVLKKVYTKTYISKC